jgi:hypothetical protein
MRKVCAECHDLESSAEARVWPWFGALTTSLHMGLVVYRLARSYPLGWVESLKSELALRRRGRNLLEPG